ncbi:MAG: 4Fe-4S binding protein, partial [Arenicellales bacterium]
MSSIPRFPIPVTVEPASPVSARGRAAWVERAGVRLRPWLPWVHAGMFVVFLVLLVGPVFLPEDTLTSELGDLGNWLIWGIWFPLVFVSVLFSGRSWCGVLCPMGAASEWVNRMGLKRPVPGWLRWEGTPVVSFVLITILGQTVGVRDYPDALLEVFGGTLVAALVIGFLYGRSKRAWCRHACPIGLLLGVFSRLGIVQFTPKHKKPGGDAYTTKGMCPTMIDIPRKEESRHCIECFRCVHPDRKGGLMVRLRHPGEEIEAIREHHPNAAEVAFLFLGTGVSLGGFLWLVLPSYQAWRQAVGEWAIDQGAYWIGQPGPWWLMSVHPAQREVFNWLDFSMIVGYMSGWMLVVAAVLSLTTVLAAAAAGRLGA